jgi:two-component sensor histidine kinase
MERIQQSLQVPLSRQHILGISNADERRMAIAILAAQIGVFEFEPQTGRAFWDDRIRDLWGVPAGEEITYETVIAQVHPDDRDMHNKQTELAIDPAGDGHMDMEYRLLPRDGKPLRWIHAIADCHFEDGEAVRLVGTVQDVTARRSSEERTKMLLNELEHRVKNILATIIAVVKMSGRSATDIASFTQAIEDRLRAMASSHELLHKNEWSAVDLHQILHREAKGFLKGDDGRLHLSGDPVTIPAAHVLTFTMGLHELLTNAFKHGALGPDGGHVNACTRVADGRAYFTWEEVLQVPMDQQDKVSKGFGSILLRDILPAELRADVSHELRPEGARYEISFPL